MRELLIVGLLAVLGAVVAVMHFGQGQNEGNYQDQSQTFYGDKRALGQGTIQSYIELDEKGHPTSIGISLNSAALSTLPSTPNPTSKCFDVNGDGSTDAASECLGDYEIALFFKGNDLKRAQIPFQWIGINWNSHGHPPVGVWTLPHFDFHFYIMDYEAVKQILPGPCGEFIDCEHFQRATMPVPSQYVPVEHVNVDGAVPGMGNHLINPASPELSDPSQLFTHTFIYGAYDGHVSFYEPMITRDYLLSEPNMCQAFHLPEAWEIEGYYPTEYCIRYHSEDDSYRVSLESFVYRVAQ